MFCKIGPISVKVKLYLYKPLGRSRRLRLPKYLDNWHKKVVRLSALPTGRLYHPGYIFGIHFEKRLS